MKYFSSETQFICTWWFVTMLMKLLIYFTQRLWQNGQHFADNILQCIFWVLIIISLKHFPKLKYQNDNEPKFVWVMAWCMFGTITLPDQIKTSLLAVLNKLISMVAMLLSTLRGQVSHISKLSYQLIPSLAPSHYLNQCWLIVNRTHRNKLQWNLS